jgi:hypothetical protein
MNSPESLVSIHCVLVILLFLRKKFNYLFVEFQASEKATTAHNQEGPHLETAKTVCRKNLTFISVIFYVNKCHRD